MSATNQMSEVEEALAADYNSDYEEQQTQQIAVQHKRVNEEKLQHKQQERRTTSSTR